MTDQTQRAAQNYFPRGLKQPEGSFRFSMDALLLASFTRPAKTDRILDLGCGCGVIALALLLEYPGATAVGLDINPALLDCAQENAGQLGLEARFQTQTLDLREISAKNSPIEPESFDLLTANPPYRRINQGRRPASPLRDNALFESSAHLADFVKAAAFALKNKGSFYCIWSGERLAELICILKQTRLEPKRLLPVQAAPNKDCGLVLVRAVKNGRPGLKLEPPLLIYGAGADNASKEPGLTPEALRFCPWLACNAKN